MKSKAYRGPADGSSPSNIFYFSFESHPRRINAIRIQLIRSACLLSEASLCSDASGAQRLRPTTVVYNLKHPWEEYYNIHLCIISTPTNHTHLLREVWKNPAPDRKRFPRLHDCIVYPTQVWASSSGACTRVAPLVLNVVADDAHQGYWVHSRLYKNTHAFVGASKLERRHFFWIMARIQAEFYRKATKRD